MGIYKKVSDLHACGVNQRNRFLALSALHAYSLTRILSLSFILKLIHLEMKRLLKSSGNQTVWFPSVYENTWKAVSKARC